MLNFRKFRRYPAQRAACFYDRLLDTVKLFHKPLAGFIPVSPARGIAYDILYDVLVKQNGDIHSDWTGVPLNVEAYKKVIFEPSDQKWIELPQEQS